MLRGHTDAVWGVGALPVRALHLPQPHNSSQDAATLDDANNGSAVYGTHQGSRQGAGSDATHYWGHSMVTVSRDGHVRLWALPPLQRRRLDAGNGTSSGGSGSTGAGAPHALQQPGAGWQLVGPRAAGGAQHAAGGTQRPSTALWRPMGGGGVMKAVGGWEEEDEEGEAGDGNALGPAWAYRAFMRPSSSVLEAAGAGGGAAATGMASPQPGLAADAGGSGQGAGGVSAPPVGEGGCGAAAPPLPTAPLCVLGAHAGAILCMDTYMVPPAGPGQGGLQGPRQEQGQGQEGLEGVAALVATGGSDKVVKVWRVAGARLGCSAAPPRTWGEREPCLVLEGHSHGVLSVKFGLLPCSSSRGLRADHDAPRARRLVLASGSLKEVKVRAARSLGGACQTAPRLGPPSSSSA